MAIDTIGEKVKKVLLVDDDLDDRELFVEAFSFINEKSHILTLEGSDGLIEFLKEMSSLPDYLFLDLNMPRINGKQCLVEIKNMPDADNIPVVIYSTSSEIKDLVEVQRLGAEAYIVKSSSIKDLVAALKDFFGSKVREV